MIPQPYSSETQPPITFVTTIYGTHYLPFLAPHLYSVERCYPGSYGAVIWQDLPEYYIDSLTAVFPNRQFVELPMTISGQKEQKISRKLQSWLAACQLYPNTFICFTDCDMLFVKPFDRFLTPDFDILFTWKPEKYPINTGFMIARNGKVGEIVFQKWAESIEETVKNGYMLDKAIASSGAADQHTLREIIGFYPSYEGSFERTISPHTFVFKGVECRLLNQTNCVPISDETHVIHYKSGWHPVLLAGEAFYGVRASQPCDDMHAFWEDTARDAYAHTTTTMVFQSAARYYEKFKPIVGGYEERGILNSEMLAVCTLCAELNVDTIIESGRARGQSTFVLAKFFANAPVDIISIDWPETGYFFPEDDEYAKMTLAPFARVQLLYGNSVELLPELVAQLAGKRIAVLLDGPKGSVAIRLLKQVIGRSGDIVVAFIHDMKQGVPQRDLMAESFRQVFFTDNKEYISLYQELDVSCLPSSEDETTPNTWRPYMKGDEQTMSYGPTLGIVLPLPHDGDADVDVVGKSTHTIFSPLMRFFVIVRQLGWAGALLRVRRRWQSQFRK